MKLEPEIRFQRHPAVEGEAVADGPGTAGGGENGECDDGSSRGAAFPEIEPAERNQQRAATRQQPGVGEGADGGADRQRGGGRRARTALVFDCAPEKEGGAEHGKPRLALHVEKFAGNRGDEDKKHAAGPLAQPALPVGKGGDEQGVRGGEAEHRQDQQHDRGGRGLDARDEKHGGHEQRISRRHPGGQAGPAAEGIAEAAPLDEGGGDQHEQAGERTEPERPGHAGRDGAGRRPRGDFTR